MPDVRKTARQNNNGTLVSITVKGMTLSTLLRKTLAPLAYDNNKFQKDHRNYKHGGSLLVKMDVEGAEYTILQELAYSNIMCEYVRMGNNATFLIEHHLQMMRDSIEQQTARQILKDARQKLKACGVQFRQLPNYWTG